MILLNFTGTARTYWIPVVERQSVGEGLWYVTVRWLGFEAVAYSRIMGAEFIRRLNEHNRSKADVPAGGASS
jgi:hypothetical protein